jgi:hypothetical protein
MSSTMIRAARAWLTALELSGERFFDCGVLEREISIHALELRVLFLELLESFQFRGAGTASFDFQL